MRRRRRRALIAAAAVAASVAAAGAFQVDALGTYVWRMDDPDFGGFSAIEMSADGSRYIALSDRATLRWGSVERDDDGRIHRLTMAGQARLKDSEGVPLEPGYRGDSEGLAQDAEGRLWVSFEGLNRVARYDDPDANATRIPSPPAFEQFNVNAGIEALAITEDGTLIAIPEEAPGDYPVFRYRDGVWDQPFSLKRDGRWLPVGADVGPDGRLYLLERDFRGLRGFVSRVRRFTLSETGLGPPEVLAESTPLQYDNLEGLSVWRDATGLRVTMISDDNFLFLQRTEIVEFRVRD